MSLAKVRRVPKVSVSDVMTSQGFIPTTSFQFPLMFFAPGTTRNQVKSGEKAPVIKLTQEQIEEIEEWASSPEQVMIAVSSIADNGCMPDPLQDRIEAAAAVRTKDLEDRVAILQGLVDRLAAQSAEKPKDDAATEDLTDDERDLDASTLDPTVIAAMANKKPAKKAKDADATAK